MHAPVLLHEDHRWVLPMIFEAQEQGRIPRPVKVILFDRHTDAAEPIAFDPFPLTHAALMHFCEHSLSPHDDDWIVAGMRLGLLDDVFIFGVDDRMGDLPKAVGDHVIMGRFQLPAHLPADISARARAHLDWAETPILLDIDLDCFAYAYREQVLAWTGEIFDRQFPPGNPAESFVQRAGLITVCREAGCCGGEENADKIWQLVQQHILKL